MMGETPSYYNIPNGRVEGISKGLKGILQQYKKEGVKLNVASEN